MVPGLKNAVTDHDYHDYHDSVLVFRYNNFLLIPKLSESTVAGFLGITFSGCNWIRM